MHIPLQLIYPGVWQLDETGGFSLSCLPLSSSLHADILHATTMIVIILKKIEFLMVQFLLRCPKDYDYELFRGFYDWVLIKITRSVSTINVIAERFKELFRKPANYALHQCHQVQDKCTFPAHQFSTLPDAAKPHQYWLYTLAQHAQNH